MPDVIYPPIIRVALSLFRGLDLKLDVRGTEHSPRKGGAVVAINHLSYLDFALAGVPFWRGGHRLVRFMAKDSVFHHPVSGPLMRGMKHIPVDRAAGADSYRAALSALRAGELVGVFPEATISQSFCLKEFKTGAVRLASEAGVPVLPLVIWGSQRVWTKGHPRDLKAARGTAVSLTLGAPLTIDPALPAAAETARLAQTMSDMLAGARERYPDVPAGGEWWLPADMGGTAPTPAQAAVLDAAEAQERSAKRAAKSGTTDQGVRS